MNRLTKEQLIKLVQKIKDADFESEEQYEKAVILFKNSVVHPDSVNLIFYHKPKLTAQEIVEKALTYKPIVIPPYKDK